MFKFKRVIAASLAVIFLAAAAYMPAAQVEAEESWPSGISVDVGAAIVMEVETGTVLYEYNADESFYPASITKVLTALLALENCDLSEIVTFSEDAVYKNEGDTSHIAREVDEEMTLENCLYGMMLESANECAWAIGEHVGGSMEAFVEMMNAKVEELGGTGTHFNNPNGLPDEDHYVTARTMALIACEAIAIPKFKEIISTLSYTIPADNKKEAYTLRQSHRMISNAKGSEYLYEYAIGGKTGYTVAAGSTLVTFAEKDGMTIVCVILSSKSPAQYTTTADLFDYCFENFGVYNVSENLDLGTLSDQDAAGVLSSKLDLVYVDEDAIIVLPTTASYSDATMSISPADDDSDAVAVVEYTYDGRVVGTANIYYASLEEETVYEFQNNTAEIQEEQEEVQAETGKLLKKVGSIIGVLLLGFLAITLIARVSRAIRRNANRKRNRSNYSTIVSNYGRNGKLTPAKRRKMRRRKDSSSLGGVVINRNTRRNKRRR